MIPINNCKIKIFNDSIYTKSDGFWFYKNNSSINSINTVKIEKRGYILTNISLKAGSIDTSILSEKIKNIKISHNFSNKVIANYEIYTNNNIINDKSNYNNQYLIDTTKVLKIVQNIFYENKKYASILYPPFKDTIINIDDYNYSANLTFAVGNYYVKRFLQNLEININSKLGKFKYFTDEFGQISINYSDVDGNQFIINIKRLSTGVYFFKI